MEREVQRCEAMWALRQAFRKRVRKQNGGSGGCMAAFEKWHFAVLRRAEAHQCDQPADPLLPSADVCDLMDTEQVLATELELEGLSSAAAESVAAWQRKQYAKGAKALRQKLRRRKGSAETGAQVVRCVEGATSVQHTLCYGRKQVQIHRTQLAKLRQLHQYPDGAGKEDLLLAVMCLLVRYQALGGNGFQCAIPAPVFTCLEELWGVQCEGPLNCRLGAGRYCSAFPDTDMAFGSLGSFFRLAPEKVLELQAFELNPPFSLELYAALLTRCHSLLEAADKEHAMLTFAIIVGATAHARTHAALQAYTESPFLQGKVIIGVGEHVYLCGGGQDDFETATFRACDTGVFILQSAAAARQMPTTPEHLQRLADAFRKTNGGGGQRREGRAGGQGGERQIHAHAEREEERPHSRKKMRKCDSKG